jgi:hypothetical protein
MAQPSRLLVWRARGGHRRCGRVAGPACIPCTSSCTSRSASMPAACACQHRQISCWQWWWQQVQGAWQASYRLSIEGSRQVRGLDVQPSALAAEPPAMGELVSPLPIALIHTTSFTKPSSFKVLSRSAREAESAYDSPLVHFLALLAVNSANHDAYKRTRLQAPILRQYGAIAI